MLRSDFNTFTRTIAPYVVRAAVCEFDILRLDGLEAAIVRVRCIARQMAVIVTGNELLQCGERM
jgi:hypothetical protein